MNDNLDERLLAVLRRYVTDPAEWQAMLEGEPLLQSTGLDSLSVVNLVTELELIFDLRFDADTLAETLQDIHTLADFLTGARGKGV
jgi:hypothetical protein